MTNKNMIYPRRRASPEGIVSDVKKEICILCGICEEKKQHMPKYFDLASNVYKPVLDTRAHISKPKCCWITEPVREES